MSKQVIYDGHPAQLPGSKFTAEDVEFVLGVLGPKAGSARRW